MDRHFQLRSLELRPSGKSKHFAPTGWPKTSSEVIRQLVSDPVASQIVEQLTERGFEPEDVDRAVETLRCLSKMPQISSLISGFVEPLLERAGETQRIHPSWQFDTSTGRLACRKPNLQNLPSPQQERYGVRDAFRARPGHIFVIADYAQLELCILAHMAGCPSMIEKLGRGGDYHSEVAAEIFPEVREAVAREEVVISSGGDGGNQGGGPARAALPTVKERFAAERSKSKAINFGIVFGKTSQSLAEDLGIEAGDAKQLMNAWFDSKPGVRTWIEEVTETAEKEQRAVSLLGRWRTLPLLGKKMYKSKSVRAAVNFGIQGSAADVVVAAMLRLWRDARLEALGFRLVMQVHDEFVLEGPTQSADEALGIITEVMEAPFQEWCPDFRLSVPLRVDARIRPSLGDGEGEQQ